MNCSPLSSQRVHVLGQKKLPLTEQRQTGREEWLASPSLINLPLRGKTVSTKFSAGGRRHLRRRGSDIRALASPVPGGPEATATPFQTPGADPTPPPALQSTDLLQLFNDAQQNMLYLNQERLRAVEELSKSTADNRFLLAQVEEIQGEAERAKAEVKVKEQQLQAQLMEVQMAASSPSRTSTPSPLWGRLWIMVDSLLLQNLVTVEEAQGLRRLVRDEDKGAATALLDWQRGGGQRREELAGRLVGLLSKRSRKGLHIIHICAELAPVAHQGSLGVWVLGLCKALRAKGQTVEVVLPLYASMDMGAVEDLTEGESELMSFYGGEWYRNKLWQGTVEGIPVTFIDPQHPAGFFSRENMYGYPDDFQRFTYLCRAALEWVLRLGKQADVLHLHDWHTAAVAPLFWELYAHKGLSHTRLLLTCHDFEQQSAVPSALLALCGLDPLQLARPDRLQDNQELALVNVLKGGIVYSNKVTTVSPEYATAVTLSRQRGAGYGLETTIIDHEKKFVGLPSGVTSLEWDPQADPFLPKPLSSADLAGKRAARDALQIPQESVMVGCVLPSASPADVEMVRKAMEGGRQAGALFVFVGAAEAVGQLAAMEGGGLSIPQRGSPAPLLRAYDERWAHCAVAAADLLLCCSDGDRAGEMAMIGAKYGALPIVRQLARQQYSSIVDIDDPERGAEEGNGFVFHHESDLPKTLQRAVQRKSVDPRGWERHRLIAMEADFSWESHGSDAYVDAYWSIKA